MTYAPGLAEFIDQCNAAMPPDFYLRPLAEQRTLYESLTTVFAYPLPTDVTIGQHVLPRAVGDLAARSYVPDQCRGPGLIVYIRGGGFVVGSLDTHNTVAAELASRTGLRTVALDFRSSPEFPFPAALEDCYELLEALFDGTLDVGEFDSDAVIVAGDSSGANMAVSVAMMSRDRHGPRLRGMALVSPVLDFTRWRHGGADAPLLTGGEMEYYTACYCPEVDTAAEPYVSPLLQGDFSDLPAAYIMGAELDSLRVDGQQLADRLEAQGSAVTHVVEPGLVHSALRARGYSPAVEAAWARFCDAVVGLASPLHVDA